MRISRQTSRLTRFSHSEPALASDGGTGAGFPPGFFRRRFLDARRWLDAGPECEKTPIQSYLDSAQTDPARRSAPRSAAQVRPDPLVEVPPRITGSHRNPGLSRRHPDLRARLQRFRADRGNPRPRQLPRIQSQAAQPTGQHIRPGRRISARPVGPRRFRADAAGEKAEPLLHVALHVAACAVRLFL